jgi:hypothetical protein
LHLDIADLPVMLVGLQHHGTVRLLSATGTERQGTSSESEASVLGCVEGGGGYYYLVYCMPRRTATATATATAAVTAYLYL